MPHRISRNRRSHGVRRPRGVDAIAHDDPGWRPESRAPSIVLLISNTDTKARLTSALARRALLTFCTRQPELLRLVEFRRVLCCIVEPVDANGVHTAPSISHLKTRFPSLAVLGYCDTSPASCHQIAAMSRAGMDTLILRGVDDGPESLRRLINEAEANWSLGHVRELLDCFDDDEVRAFVRLFLGPLTFKPTVGAAAKELGLSRRTLAHRLSQNGLPSPAVLASWCRMLTAANLLRDPGRSVERVAMWLGFGCGAGLRNMLRRRANVSPSEVRGDEGFQRLVDSFRVMVNGTPHGFVGGNLQPARVPSRVRLERVMSS
jgi:AraC-like DNA-binding protein